MVRIIVYKNGFEIKGHTNPKTCAEVSILAWACANTIYNKYDEGEQFYQSAIDNKENPSQGYTWMIFNQNIEGANRVFKEWEHNIAVPLDTGFWDKLDVVIEYIDEFLIK